MIIPTSLYNANGLTGYYAISTVCEGVRGTFIIDVSSESFKRSLAENNLSFPKVCEGVLFDVYSDDTMPISGYIRYRRAYRSIRTIRYAPAANVSKNVKVAPTINDLIDMINGFAIDIHNKHTIYCPDSAPINKVTVLPYRDQNDIWSWE